MVLYELIVKETRAKFKIIDHRLRDGGNLRSAQFIKKNCLDMIVCYIRKPDYITTSLYLRSNTIILKVIKIRSLFL